MGLVITSWLADIKISNMDCTNLKLKDQVQNKQSIQLFNVTLQQNKSNATLYWLGYILIVELWESLQLWALKIPVCMYMYL